MKRKNQVENNTDSELESFGNISTVSMIILAILAVFTINGYLFSHILENMITNY